MKGTGNAQPEVERATGSAGETNKQTNKQTDRQTKRQRGKHTWTTEDNTFMKPATKARNNNKLALADCGHPFPSQSEWNILYFMHTILHFVVHRNKAWHSCCTYNTLGHRIRPTGLGQQTEMATWMLYRWWLSLFPKWHKNLQFFPNKETINEVLLKTCDFKQSQLAQSAFQHIFKRS